MQKDLTHGDTLQLIILFALPLIGGAIFQQLYNIVDTMIVGQFVGVNALAAVGSTGSLMFLVLGFALGITAGFGIPIAQAFGAQDQKLVLNTIMNAVYLSILITILLTGLMAVFTDNLLDLMQTPSSIYEDSYNYISIIFYGIVCTIFYNLLASISRALGDSKTPLKFLILSSLLNVGLDLFMIVVLKMGVRGAALATITSQGISAILCFIYMYKKNTNLRFNTEDKKVNVQVCKKLLGIALPMALQYSITAIGSVVLQSATNTFGTVKIAAITAGQKAHMLFTQPMDQLGAAMATFCGQNLGAGKKDRILKGIKQSLIVVVIYAICACLFMRVFGKNLALIFVDASQEEVIGYTQDFLLANSSFYFVLGILFVSRNIIQGLGKSAITMLAGVAEMIGRCMVAFYLSKAFGFNAILFSNPIAWWCGIIILIPMLTIQIKKLKRK